jgi:hypothetical protein
LNTGDIVVLAMDEGQEYAAICRNPADELEFRIGASVIMSADTNDNLVLVEVGRKILRVTRFGDYDYATVAKDFLAGNYPHIDKLTS